MKCQIIMDAMEQLAPKKVACDWDNVGLLVGSPQQEVKRILVCLDATEDTAEQAIRKGCDMIISHHPVIFEGMKKMRTDLYMGRFMQKLLVNNIAVFSAHTNLDMSDGGVNDVLAELIGLEKIKHFLDGEEIIGRIGYLPEEKTIEEFAQQVKNGIGAEYIRLVKSGDKKVRKVALCSGAGAGFLFKAAFQGADCYLTGDVKYHDGQHAVEQGIHMIDGGHFATEYPVRLVLAKRLQELLQEQGKGEIEILCDDESRDVFQIM